MRVDELPETIVVDAGVGLKWVIDEPGSDAAVALVAGQALVTSALFWVEAANVLATKERWSELDRVALEDAWHDLVGAPLDTMPLGQAEAKRSLDLAFALRHPVHDCCYLVVALARSTLVLTADRRFRRLAERYPSVAGSVVHLDELQP